MVYVLNNKGKPLMPTNRHGKVRHLLEDGKAKVVCRTPFTIQLLYESENYIQEVNLGVDAGSKHIGLSATTKDKVLYEADVEVRNDIVNLISTRRQNRRSRRIRKTRYRASRFNNRKKKEGWLAPSVNQKIETHLKVVDNVCKILPIKNIIVEVASFDIQKIKNPEISGKEYQQGEQLGFLNVKQYVLFRDGYTCQHCKSKNKNKKLVVHHIISRKTGGNAPNNLITLCEECHKKYHEGKIKLSKNIKRGKSFKDAAFMGIMRWAFLDKLKEKYKNVSCAYGFETKYERYKYNLPKEHYIDARCISGNPTAKSNGIVYYQKKVRCHNRQIHKMKFKNGIRKRNQASYIVRGFRLFDKVEVNKVECFIFARRMTGSMDVRKLDGTTISASIIYKKIKFIEPRRKYLIERRSVLI